MSVSFMLRRNLWARALGAVAALAIAACEPIDFAGLTGGDGQAINPNAAVPVALLVPRGGGNPTDDVLAQSLENAARLAVADLEGAVIDLRVYGTGGNAATAASQAQVAVNDGAKIILGPVYAEAANAAGVAVADDNVNVLAFSNNPAIAGGNVFILGSTFRNTADRLSRYAARQGRNKIVLVHGNDVPGQAGRDAILSSAAGSGAQIVASVDYAVSQEGVSAAIPRIKSAVESTGANAIFLTSTTAGALSLYATLLPEAGIGQDVAQYIGLTRWDIPAQTLSLPGLQGGWFALPDPGRTAGFAQRYLAAYGASPHPIGGLAYDGIAAIGALVAAGNRDALTKSALTQSAGFQGTGGVFRLNGDGTNQRAVAVAAVQGGQRVILDPAPQGFGGF